MKSIIVALLIFIPAVLIKLANLVCDTGCLTPSANRLTSNPIASSFLILLRTIKSLKNILLYTSFSQALFAIISTNSGNPPNEK